MVEQKGTKDASITAMEPTDGVAERTDILKKELEEMRVICANDQRVGDWWWNNPLLRRKIAFSVDHKKERSNYIHMVELELEISRLNFIKRNGYDPLQNVSRSERGDEGGDKQAR